MPSATPGSSTNTYGNTVKNQSGPQGPFTALGTPLQTAATDSLNAGKTVLNTAFDPQKALYNQLAQNNSDQTNVAEAQRGVTMSPYGAGVANQSRQNFDINWQNNQLQRQTEGINANNAAMGPATNLYNSSYGTNTQGYGTSPPQPVQPVQQVQPRAAAPVQTQTPQWQFPSAPQAQNTSPYQPLGLPMQPQPQGGGYTGPQSLLTPQGNNYNSITNPQVYSVDANGDPIPNDSSSGLYGDGSYGGQLPPDQSTDTPYDPFNSLSPEQSSVITQSPTGQAVMSSMADLVGSW
jgi:hypothetical protein